MPLLLFSCIRFRNAAIFFQNAVHHAHGPVHKTAREGAVSGDKQRGVSFSAGVCQQLKNLGAGL
jgi:hypothetical protein